MALVFQYGSNLDLHRLNGADRLNGAATFRCTAETIDNFDFVFDLWSKGGKCAAADILNGGLKKIWGAIYVIPDGLIRRETSGSRLSLDAIEGQGSNYQRIYIQLRDKDGQLLPGDVITYVGLPKARRDNIQTTQRYIDHILKGADDWELPEGYIAYLKQQILANNPALQLP